jgi:ribosome recycling factor
MKPVEVSGMQMLTIKPWERLRTKEMNPRSISSASITIEPHYTKNK